MIIARISRLLVEALETRAELIVGPRRRITIANRDYSTRGGVWLDSFVIN